MIDLRLANHCRRMRVSSFDASVLSRAIQRATQRYSMPRWLRSSSRPGRVALGKPEDASTVRRCSVAEHRLEAADERRVDQDGVEMHRRLGYGDRVPARRDRAVQIGQGLGIIERADLGHEAFHADRARARSRRRRPASSSRQIGRDRAGRSPSGSSSSARSARLTWSGGGMIEQGQVIGALEALAAARPAGRSLLLESRAPLMVDQPGGRVRETRIRDSRAPACGRPRRTRPSRSRSGAARC